MDFFDKLGKKASEAYKVTADKTGKIAKETKLKFKISDLKAKINDIYEEIGKKVYEKHVMDEEISISKDLSDECNKIDEMSKEIETLLKECLDLKDKKQCPKCFKEIDKEMRFCPECGAKQEIVEVKEAEIVTEEKNAEEKNQDDQTQQENKQDNNSNDNNEQKDSESSGEQTNLEKTTEVEINPDPQDITEEELKNIGN